MSIGLIWESFIQILAAPILKACNLFSDTIKRIQVIGFQFKEIDLLLKISYVFIFNISNLCIGC